MASSRTVPKAVLRWIRAKVIRLDDEGIARTADGVLQGVGLIYKGYKSPKASKERPK